MPPIEPTVLGNLYRQHAPALRLYARQWGSSGEDLVQVAFVRLAQQSPPPERILPWLYAVVRNEAHSVQRSTIRRRQREQERCHPEAWFDAADSRLDAAEVAAGLAELPLELREVIVAHIWGGLVFEDIAAMIGCSVATAHRRYQAGLAQLRQRYQLPCNPTAAK
ncbi:MAG TPA: sigma-70 family RNA polymerase sigma factor [Gemmataceae bacterium]|jgi:RNA polymerase sigma-70 factor (ECF subfamily)|nr:sigma-70 family RNA polymerase sigma factor [Gemmataceae bacterium]